MKQLKEKPNLKKENLKIIKIFMPEIRSINLKIQYGVENSAISALIYPILKTTLISFFKRDLDVQVIFNNENQLNIYLEGIFELKLIHIINKLIIYNKDRRVDKNERTSNRRTYAYGHE